MNKTLWTDKFPKLKVFLKNSDLKKKMKILIDKLQWFGLEEESES